MENRWTDAQGKIQGLSGAEQLKAFALKLEQLARNAHDMQLETIPLPNLVFAASPGCGVTLYIHLLTDLLKALRLMPFSGEEECFEWALGTGEKDFSTFLRRVRSAAGFYDRFQGVIGLDVTALMKGPHRPVMEQLMAYVDARQGQILFVFRIPIDTPKAAQNQLLGAFANRTPVEIIALPFPKQDAMAYVENRLRDRRFSLTPDAAQYLGDVLAALSELRDFDGYRTLQNLTDEILWHKLSAARAADRLITRDDVAFILAADGYRERLGAGDDRRRIGFASERRG